MADTETVDGYMWTYEITNGTAAICGTFRAPGVAPAPIGAVTIPATLGGKTVTEIGYKAFEGCSGMTSVTIPDSVTHIGDSAFYRCSGLTSMTIPNNVTNIGEAAFYGCDNLTDMTLPFLPEGDSFSWYNDYWLDDFDYLIIGPGILTDMASRIFSARLRKTKTHCGATLTGTT